MGSRHALLLAALLLAALALARGEVDAAWCEEVATPTTAAFDKSLSKLYACSSVPPFMLAYMWSPVQITIQCPTSWYSVYKGDSQELLRKNIKDRTTAFCGWERFLDGTRCRFQMSPFWQTYVGIADGRGCQLHSSVEFSLSMMVASAIGVGLFYLAPHLTSSIFFRLSCGSLMFTAGSLVILAFILMRHIPHKRAAGVAVGLMGTSGLAAVRWVTGQWLPSWAQLTQNPLFQAYVLASAIVGAALTYWFDDRASPKLNTLILAALRTAALALVYYGTWVMPVAFAGVSGVLLTSLISPQIHANMETTRVRVQRVTSATAALIMSPFTDRQTPQPGSGAGAAAAGQGAASASPGLSGFSFWGSGSAAARRQARLQELEEQRARRAALGLPTSDDPDVSMLTPLHLKTPPPDPWSLAVKPREGAKQVLSFEQKYSEALAKLQRQSPGGGARRRAAPGVTSSAVDAAGPAASGTDLSGGAAYIQNPQTGRSIKIGGDTYMRLLEAGWAPDLQQGTMVAPQAEGGSGRGATRDSSRVSSGQGKARSSQRT